MSDTQTTISISPVERLIREISQRPTPLERGTLFENLAMSYLIKEPRFSKSYQKIETYGDWAEANGRPRKDIGIDLVGTSILSDQTVETTAIQCKFREDPKIQITKAELDSFLSISAQNIFTKRVLITTTLSLGSNASETLRDQPKPVIVITLTDLEESAINWDLYRIGTHNAILKPKKQPRPHQTTAIKNVLEGFKTSDRGKLIMACGTGKTFTSLKIAEEIAPNGRVLFVVPSLALVSQALTEWSQECEKEIMTFAVCSDNKIGIRKIEEKQEEDSIDISISELAFPATTNPQKLADSLNRNKSKFKGMQVVFSTYHSLEVIGSAQKEFNLNSFDLIICDEAHNTTGSTELGQTESYWVAIHKNGNIKGDRRLYMTATPEIYGPDAKETASKKSIELSSMDNEEIYGPTFHLISFSKAVEQKLLVDYKVSILTISEDEVAEIISGGETGIRDSDSAGEGLKVTDRAKIIGCWKALSKKNFDTADLMGDNKEPMKRAVAYCQRINYSAKSKKQMVASKTIAASFQKVVEEYQKYSSVEPAARITCEANHIDGTMGAKKKAEKISWLRSNDVAKNSCRVLCNVRCLAEGVDVPSLDAVMFFSPKKSQIEVVQSVGRVMRLAEGKEKGYVVIPVVIPAGIEPEVALNDNTTYEVVWQVLQALRAHDDRFEAIINRMKYGEIDFNHIEIINVINTLRNKSGPDSPPETPPPSGEGGQGVLDLPVGAVEKAIYSKMVRKVGSRFYFEEWAKNVGQIARTVSARIQAIIQNKNNTKEQKAFIDFVGELRSNLNDSISEQDVVEMLAQHLITQPIFSAIFSEIELSKSNPISRAMDAILALLYKHDIEDEVDILEAFYEGVRTRIAGTKTAQAKQKILIDLYEKFFKGTFPKVTDKLGIVFTPLEVVDFVLKSVDVALRKNFQKSIAEEGVQVLDPFTGTGTFITRLIQDEILIPEDKLEQKYTNELHANELVLLAYYVATINIEAAYMARAGLEYKPFNGGVLTDTFESAGKDSQLSTLQMNNRRRLKQDSAPITVIVGNPPYSVGQKSQNENNQNLTYPQLDEKIAQTYVKESNSTNSGSNYDSYIRAIRWASNRIGEKGVIGFVTNAGFLKAKAADGIRRCLEEEFSSIYFFDLRGDARTKGIKRKQEMGNVFGSGSRTPIVISILVKNPAAKEHGKVYYYDIGDYLTRSEKLQKIKEIGAIDGISLSKDSEITWDKLKVDTHGDWFEKRDPVFENFWVLGHQQDKTKSIFEEYSSGVGTNRDSWSYNSSKRILADNIRKSLNFYNSEINRYEKEKSKIEPKDFINRDSKKISWSRGLIGKFKKGDKLSYKEPSLVKAQYRPFNTQWLYFNRSLLETPSQIPSIFPTPKHKNIVICISNDQVFITDLIADIHLNGDTICFPYYYYVNTPSIADNLQEKVKAKQIPIDSKKIELKPSKKDSISNNALEHFQEPYNDNTISKEDLFYYIYGVLHSPNYKKIYKNNLKKELPRIPRVKEYTNFLAFSTAGRKLADLHINYETKEPYKVKVNTGGKTLGNVNWNVSKMKYGGNKGADKTIIIYNDDITITDIPIKCHEYTINGLSALDWIVDRQKVKTDKKNDIVNDPNDWANETMKDDRYTYKLIQKVITISLESLKIINKLPTLDLLDE